MNSKAEKERTKQIHDKCQRLLNEMLKDDDNKYCVDCDAKGPRWASWNIGVFLCIRCAGIHRKLGVHISRVKSVNLDTWTPQQVVCLQQMGNSKARAVYEANLPDNFRRPQNEGSLESFIRAKYEQKKFIAREWVAPALPKVNWDKELDEEAEKLRKKKREVIQSNLSSIRPISTAAPVIPQPLPKPQSSSPKPSRTSSHTTDLLGLDTPTKEPANKSASSDSDLFTTFLDASSETTSNISTPANETSASAATLRTEEEDSFFNQSLSSTPGKQQPLTNDSILALYGNPGKFASPSLNLSAGSHGFNPSATNGMNAFSRPAMPTSLQHDLANSGLQFPTANPAISSNVGFSANPFYSMAASGFQNNFPSQKAFSMFPATNGSASLDLHQAQMTQQLDSLNLNKPNQASFQQTNFFDIGSNGQTKTPQNGQSAMTAADLWQ